MSITNYQVVTATRNDVSRLAADVNAAIANGWQPVGSAALAGNQIHQTMVKTTANLTTYTTNGAISTTPGLKIVSRTSAAAMTLAAPANDGDEISIIAGTAFAHVITATDLVDDGVTGGAKDAITLGAFVGACATLIGVNGHWALKSKTVATVAAV